MCIYYFLVSSYNIPVEKITSKDSENEKIALGSKSVTTESENKSGKTESLNKDFRISSKTFEAIKKFLEENIVHIEKNRFTTKIKVSNVRIEEKLFKYTTIIRAESKDGFWETRIDFNIKLSDLIGSKYKREIIGSMDKLQNIENEAAKIMVFSKDEKLIFDSSVIQDAGGYYKDQVVRNIPVQSKEYYFGFSFQTDIKAKYFENIWSVFIYKLSNNIVDEIKVDNIFSQNEKKNNSAPIQIDGYSNKKRKESEYKSSLGNLYIGSWLFYKSDHKPFGIVTEITWRKIAVLKFKSNYQTWYERSFITSNYDTK